MGRFWLGFGILLSLLALGIFLHLQGESAHSAISHDLNMAAEEMLQGNTANAHRLAQQAHSTWDRRWRSTAAATAHAPMDEIDGLFAALEIYRQTDDRIEFAAHCARLSMLIEAVGESQTISWWNLL